MTPIIMESCTASSSPKHTENLHSDDESNTMSLRSKSPLWQRLRLCRLYAICMMLPCICMCVLDIVDVESATAMTDTMYHIDSMFSPVSWPTCPKHAYRRRSSSDVSRTEDLRKLSFDSSPSTFVPLHSLDSFCDSSEKSEVQIISEMPTKWVLVLDSIGIDFGITAVDAPSPSSRDNTTPFESRPSSPSLFAKISSWVGSRPSSPAPSPPPSRPATPPRPNQTLFHDKKNRISFFFNFECRRLILRHDRLNSVDNDAVPSSSFRAFYEITSSRGFRDAESKSKDKISVPAQRLDAKVWQSPSPSPSPPPPPPLFPSQNNPLYQTQIETIPSMGITKVFPDVPLPYEESLPNYQLQFYGDVVPHLQKALWDWNSLFLFYFSERTHYSPYNCRLCQRIVHFFRNTSLKAAIEDYINAHGGEKNASATQSCRAIGRIVGLFSKSHASVGNDFARVLHDEDLPSVVFDSKKVLSYI